MKYLHYTYKNKSFLIVDNYPFNIQIRDSYHIKRGIVMARMIDFTLSGRRLGEMHRTKFGCIVEWRLHNIGYHLVLPIYHLSKKDSVLLVLNRLKDVDLNNILKTA